MESSQTLQKTGDAVFALLVSSCLAAVIACGPVAAFSYLFDVGGQAMTAAMAVAFVSVSSLLAYGLMGVRKRSLARN